VKSTEPTRAQLARRRRERRIVEEARAIAEADGWAAVTVRRLADAIGFSQPVLYGHFADGRDGIVRAVALDGFERMASQLEGADGVAEVAARYLSFARDNPAAYEAMFSMPIDLAFGTDATPTSLRRSFAAIERAVSPDADDRETEAELLWATLHGIAELGRHHRLRPSHAENRIAALVTRSR
jgi:AcrR family transcriptional regulator